MALTGLALGGWIATDAARAQTAEPPQPLTPPSQAPAAAAPVAPASGAVAPETTATAVAGDDKAPSAPGPRKAKRKTAGASVAVTVVNARTAELVSLEAGLAGSDKWKTIAGPLAPGKSATARAPRGKDCLVDLKGTFADGETMDASGVDVCSQKVLNLTQ